MTKHIWWTEPEMTKAGAVKAAAAAAGVLLEAFDGQIDDLDVPMVAVEAHGGLWLIYPDPFTILGWVAEQAKIDDTGDFVGIDGTVGWLGAGDLEADRIVANLLEADELPTDLYHREPAVSTRRAGQEAKS